MPPRQSTAGLREATAWPGRVLLDEAGYCWAERGYCSARQGTAGPSSVLLHKASLKVQAAAEGRPTGSDLCMAHNMTDKFGLSPFVRLLDTAPGEA